MRLIPARSLDDFEQDAEELAGWRERQTRKDRRRRRRESRQVHRRERRERRRVQDVPSSPRRAAPLRPDAEPPPEDAAWEPAEDEAVDDLLDVALDELQGRGRRRPRKEDGWSRAIRMSRNLRVQAAQGYRAAVMELRPGLYLVAEMPEDAARSEFGFAPLLAPLMIRSARRAMERPEPTARPLLPGPVAGELPVIDVGWADPADVAHVGCDCDRRRP